MPWRVATLTKRLPPSLDATRTPAAHRCPSLRRTSPHTPGQATVPSLLCASADVPVPFSSQAGLRSEAETTPRETQTDYVAVLDRVVPARPTAGRITLSITET